MLTKDTTTPHRQTVLTLQAHTLNDQDLFAFVTNLTTFCNSKALSSDASEAVIDLLNQAEIEFFNRPSATPADALCKIVHLAQDEISSEFGHGNVVLSGAKSVLARLANLGRLA